MPGTPIALRSLSMNERITKADALQRFPELAASVFVKVIEASGC